MIFPLPEFNVRVLDELVEPIETVFTPAPVAIATVFPPVEFARLIVWAPVPPNNVTGPVLFPDPPI